MVGSERESLGPIILSWLEAEVLSQGRLAEMNVYKSLPPNFFLQKRNLIQVLMLLLFYWWRRVSEGLKNQNLYRINNLYG